MLYVNKSAKAGSRCSYYKRSSYMKRKLHFSNAKKKVYEPSKLRPLAKMTS